MVVPFSRETFVKCINIQWGGYFVLKPTLLIMPYQCNNTAVCCSCIGLLFTVLYWAGLLAEAENAASYQNYLITIEMFLAAILLKFAFPYRPYMELRKDDKGRGIPMQKISSHFKDTLNPHDVVNDAIHNFSRVYQQYAQQANEDNSERSKSPNSDTSSLDGQQTSNGTKSHSPNLSTSRKKARLEKEPEREVLLVESDEDEIM